MQNSAGEPDRILRLVVGTVLLGVALATYTEHLSVTQSLFLSSGLVASILVSVVFRHATMSLHLPFRSHHSNQRLVSRTDDLHPP